MRIELENARADLLKAGLELATVDILIPAPQLEDVFVDEQVIPPFVDEPLGAKFMVRQDGPDAVVVKIMDEAMLPAIVDGDARKTTIKVADIEKTVKLQKSREGFITINDEVVAL